MTNPSDSPTVIAYSVAGSGTGGSDYASLSGTITIPAGQTSATIDVTVIDDVVIEGNEDVIVMLTSITSGDPQISIDTANDIDTVTIADDDEATWDLTGVSTVNEGAVATYSLNLDGTLQSGETASVELSIGDQHNHKTLTMPHSMLRSRRRLLLTRDRVRSHGLVRH